MRLLKHTPGPWSVSTDGWLEHHVDLNAPDYGAIAEVLITMDDGLASTELAHNAILMSASPDMLDTLIKVQEWLTTTHLRPVSLDGTDLTAELSAVIKKATNS